MESPAIQVSHSPDQVPVYILSADSHSVRTKLTRNMFNDAFFDANVVSIDTPKNIEYDGISKEKAEEYYRFRKVLSYSKEQNQKDIIIIKDTSVTNSQPDAIAEAIRVIVDSDEEDRADITYLSSWLGDCENLKNKRFLSNNTSVIAKTSSANGLQAILVSPKGRDIILGETRMAKGGLFSPKADTLSDALNKSISDGNITADVVIPNLFDYDIVNGPKKIWKTALCRKKKEVAQPVTPNVDINNIIPEERDVQDFSEMRQYTGVSPIVIIFILLIIAFIIWGIYYYTK